MIVFVLVWFGAALIGLLVFLSYMVNKSLDERGLKLEKKTRYRRRTYDDVFGKRIVDIKDEEWIIKPKNEIK